MPHTPDRPDASFELDNHLLQQTLSQEGFVYVEPNTDPKVTNTFLTQVLAFEAAAKGPHGSIADRLPADFDLPDPVGLLDQEIEIKLAELVSLLSDRGVVVDLVGKLPDRLTYQYLFNEALDEEIPLMVPEGTRYHIDGCDGCCEACFQLPYCEVGQENQREWSEAV